MSFEFMIKTKKMLFAGLAVLVVAGMYSVTVSMQNYEDIIEKKEDAIDSLQDRINALLEKEERLTEEKDLLENQHSNLEKDNKTLNETIEGLKSDIENTKKDNEDLRRKLDREKKLNKTSRGSGITKKTAGGSFKDFQATAYCGCSKCNGKWTGMPTASGTSYKADRTIAVDPKVIPLGSKVEIQGMGTYTAEDTGSAIKNNIVDIYFNSHAEALKFGRRKIKLRVL